MKIRRRETDLKVVVSWVVQDKPAYLPRSVASYEQEYSSMGKRILVESGEVLWLISAVFNEEEPSNQSFTDKVKELRAKYVEQLNPYKNQIVLMVLRK